MTDCNAKRKYSERYVSKMSRKCASVSGLNVQAFELNGR